MLFFVSTVRASLKSGESIVKFNEQRNKLAHQVTGIPPLLKCLFEALRKHSVGVAEFQALPTNLDKYRSLLQDMYTGAFVGWLVG